MTDYNLAAARYQSFKPTMGVPLRTSVGGYRRKIERLEYVKELAPWGIFRNAAYANATMEEKEAAYHVRLDNLKRDLLKQLDALTAKYPGEPLVMLCFEDVHKGEICHRTWARDWFKNRLGLIVPEVSPGPAATTTVREEAAGLW